MRIDVCVDQFVSVDKWRRQYSFDYVVAVNHVTAVRSHKVFKNLSEGCLLN